MASWADGYVTDILYTHGYYSHINPSYAKFLILSKGFAVREENCCHCELGFGQGLSINIHAAASGDTWYGNDFNPAQVEYARKLASISGADLHLYEDSFEEFLARKDLPEFDSISLHGIWSWINHDNKKLIAEFLKRRLKPGGVVYLSYNTMPGWAGFLPVRALMNQYLNIGCPTGKQIGTNIDESLNFIDSILQTNPTYAKLHPHLIQKIKDLQKSPREYLAHEYFNQTWTPVFFSEMQEFLSQAKLSFACPATPTEHIDEINLTSEQIKILERIDSVPLREETRDLMVNQQFRRDYWIKGPRRLGQHEKHEQLRKLRIVLRTKKEDIDLTVKGVRGKHKLDKAQFGPVLEVMQENIPITLAEIESNLAHRGIDLELITRITLALFAMNVILPAQEELKQDRSIEMTTKLNRFILDQAEFQEKIGHLSSPVLGGGFAVDHATMLSLLGYQRGLRTSAELATFVGGILKSRGQTLLHEGQPLRSGDALDHFLVQRADQFIERTIPLMQKIKVI